MGVSAALQAALDRAESVKADAQTKIAAVLDAKTALEQATAADAAAVNSADAAAAALDQARQAVIDAATTEFTLASPVPGGSDQSGSDQSGAASTDASQAPSAAVATS